jgi:hypothetical protein
VTFLGQHIALAMGFFFVQNFAKMQEIKNKSEYFGHKDFFFFLFFENNLPHLDYAFSLVVVFKKVFRQVLECVAI